MYEKDYKKNFFLKIYEKWIYRQDLKKILVLNFTL